MFYILILHGSFFKFLVPFENVVKPADTNGNMHNCPCCYFPTLSGRGCFEICSKCNWEDDGQDDHDADEVRGGPNGSLSLTMCREAFKKQNSPSSVTALASAEVHSESSQTCAHSVSGGKQKSYLSAKERRDLKKGVKNNTGPKSSAEAQLEADTAGPLSMQAFNREWNSHKQKKAAAKDKSQQQAAAPGQQSVSARTKRLAAKSKRVIETCVFCYFILVIYNNIFLLSNYSRTQLLNTIGKMTRIESLLLLYLDLSFRV